MQCHTRVSLLCLVILGAEVAFSNGFQRLSEDLKHQTPKDSIFGKQSESHYSEQIFKPPLKRLIRESDNFENRQRYFPDWSSEDYSLDTSTQESNDEDVSSDSIIAGLDTVRPINEEHCTPRVLRLDKSLSSPAECARTCEYGARPKTCYYHWVIESQPVNGLACLYCTPNATNVHCPNCQCIPADGVERMALTVNRMIPGPAIEVCLGDHVVIDVENRVKGRGMTIHWHGIFQEDSQYYDGVPYVTQCPINSGTTFRYQWNANNPGTHFWHAHTGLDKMDGIFGRLIIRQSSALEPHSFMYNYDLSEHVIVLNDWMHEDAEQKFPGRRKLDPGQLPDSILINGKGRYVNPESGVSTKTGLAVFKVRAGRRYRFRLINSFCTVCPAQITIQHHNLSVIATDGQAVDPVVVNSIISFAGERYDFVLDANQHSGSYWIQVRGIGVCAINQIQQIAILQYTQGYYRPYSRPPSYDKGLPRGIVLNPLDGVCNPPKPNAICISNLRSVRAIDPDLLKPEVDIKIFLPIRFHVYDTRDLFTPGTYYPYMVQAGNITAVSLIDGINFKFPPSPPISQPEDLTRDQFCNSRTKPESCANSKICQCTHMIEIEHNAIVEIILVDEYQATDILHPFHLHGHKFHVLSMGQPFNEGATRNNLTSASLNSNTDENQRRRSRINLAYAMELDKRNQMRRLFEAPPGKDTIPVPNNGFVVLRFRANNPGYWLFHCHYIYHQMVGMDLIMRVGKQSDLPPVPQGFPKCGNFVPSISQSKSVSTFECPFSDCSQFG